MTHLALLSVIVATLLSTMGVRAWVERRSEQAMDRHEARQSFLVGGFLVRWFYWLIAPLERALIRLGVGPLFFNLAGLASGMTAGALFALGQIPLAGWAVLAAGICDIFDGRIARSTGVADRRGAFIDSTLDRFSETATFLGLAVLFAGSRVAVGVVAGALGGSLLVSYARARGESLGVVCRGGIMQRQERVLLLGFGAILDAAASSFLDRPAGTLLIVIVTVMAVGTVATALYRTVAIARRLHDGSD